MNNSSSSLLIIQFILYCISNNKAQVTIKGTLECGGEINGSINVTQIKYYSVPLNSNYENIGFEGCQSDFDVELYLYDNQNNVPDSPIIKCSDCQSIAPNRPNCNNKGATDLLVVNISAGNYIFAVGVTNKNKPTGGNYIIQLSCTEHPTLIPSLSPTFNPTNIPTKTTTFPTISPTQIPTTSLTYTPSILPTKNPITATPTTNPTFTPSLTPITSHPTFNPTNIPTETIIFPTISPTILQTQIPTTTLTHTPSISPTKNPTTPTPTTNPTLTPSLSTITFNPTNIPTETIVFPTISPTQRATISPTYTPSIYPTKTTEHTTQPQITSIQTSELPEIEVSDNNIIVEQTYEPKNALRTEGNNLNEMLIISLTIGGFAGLCCCIVVIIYCVLHKHKHGKKETVKYPKKQPAMHIKTVSNSNMLNTEKSIEIVNRYGNDKEYMKVINLNMPTDIQEQTSFELHLTNTNVAISGVLMDDIIDDMHRKSVVKRCDDEGVAHDETNSFLPTRSTPQ